MSPIADLLSKFQSAIQTRRQFEQQLSQLNAAPDRTITDLRNQLQSQIQLQNEQLEAFDAQVAQQQSELVSQWDGQLDSVEAEHRVRTRELESLIRQQLDHVEKQKDESCWVVSSVLDDQAQDSPAREFERFKSLVTKSRESLQTELTAVEELFQKLLEDKGWHSEPQIPELEPVQDRDEASALFEQNSKTSRQLIRKIQRSFVFNLFVGLRPFLLFLILGAVVSGSLLMLANPEAWEVSGSRFGAQWIGITAASGFGFSLICLLALLTAYAMLKSSLLSELQNRLSEAKWAQQQWLQIAKTQYEEQQKSFEKHQRVMEAQRKGALARYRDAHSQTVQEIQTRQQNEMDSEIERFRVKHNQLAQQKQQALAGFEQESIAARAQLVALWQQQINSIESSLAQSEGSYQSLKNTQWTQLKEHWTTAWQELDRSLKSDVKSSLDHSPEWKSLISPEQVPEKIPPAIRLGRLNINLDDWPEAIPEDARLAPRHTELQAPLQVLFPSQASLGFQTPTPASRAAAIHGIQVYLLRLLSKIPLGKLRLTIIDPVGLGENFGGFMHLGDIDELMISSRVWTEANHIEKRLEDLTEHMENVLQKYLRNEFETIEDYNASAGEVSEPYHFLVVTDFPANFSEIAARRLVSIINSGPRCGVYTILTTDPAKPLPHHFSLSDIEEKLTWFDWKHENFHVRESMADRWPIEFDSLPESDTFTRIVKRIGSGSRDARKVEVSFNRIQPRPQEVWTHDSRKEISAPMGRAGATKLQEVRLGRGTSQHMLVAGKTGSGKSTFLHILITNLALYYSPEEINFFLIDFKKGVEFKAYATHKLPHAQVIAVESDREFGVSALQRLGDLLQERGELFRKHGVQDIAGYRSQTEAVMPRVLLVIDEFQEFFVEEDKISQQATLLLDRLVRQGRAFGIHVILGSQTLGGAYSLARSTLGQVAVRVALQCSEGDAHLILSEENSAARLLTRPGEAIYNDANGLMEGNHPFQIAWISDEEREQALNQMQQLLKRKSMTLPHTIVFEGNIPSRLHENQALNQIVSQYPTREEPIQLPTISVGDSVEIAPPTEITFHRQNGKNLLLVGQDVEAAQGVLSAVAISLMASGSPRQEQNSVFLLDGSHPETDEIKNWNSLEQRFPSEFRSVPGPELPVFLQAMSAELQHRESTPGTQFPPLFVIVFNLARFRELRKVEDDYGMSQFGMGASEPKPPEPGKLFADLITKGPAVGIHVLIWCDSYNNLERWLSRNTLREIENRIAFQMNSADSTNLIDTPAAARLGAHRALLYREETGTTEKFRPYGMPTGEWLDQLQKKFQSPSQINSSSETPSESASGSSSDSSPDSSDPLEDLEEFTIL